MKRELNLGGGMRLPGDAVTETFGLLAARGSGKTNTARVMAEEMFSAGLPFVVVDPVGSWYGLRSSRDGKGAGLEIPIFGGKHGDVRLERGGGQLIADLIVDDRMSCILDLSGFDSEGGKKAFLLDFARRLYQRNEEPLHLFLEEADDYIPQRPMRDEAQLLRAWENIVRRGRGRGLGMTLITQRSASLNKNVLTQVQTLIAMRTTGPQDRAAIADWLKYHDQSQEILESLPKLESGEAWVWSPQFLKMTKRVRFRLSRTYDSGATPRMAKKGRAPVTLADVDLASIEKQMAETIERAKAEDPKALRAQVATLQRELADAKKHQPAPKVERVDVPILKDAQLGRLEKAIERLARHGRDVVSVVQELAAAISAHGNGHAPGNLVRDGDFASKPNWKASPPPVRKAMAADLRDFRTERLDPATVGTTKMHRAILTALAQHPKGLSKGQILVHTGYRSSGPVSSAFADLRAAGLTDGTGLLTITRDGLSVLGDYEPLPSGAELRRFLLEGPRLSKMEKALLGQLLEAYPRSITKGLILERTGYGSSGPVSSAFAKLVKIGYAIPAGRSELRASEELFG